METDTATRSHGRREWFDSHAHARLKSPVHDYQEKADHEWSVKSHRVPHLRVVFAGGLSKVQAVSSNQNADLVELRRLADEWRADTMFVSSAHEQILHPSYQKIIGFGQKALPFLIDELRAADGNWFWALNMITRIDPVAPADRGNFNAMKKAWLNWAVANGM